MTSKQLFIKLPMKKLLSLIFLPHHLAFHPNLRNSFFEINKFSNKFWIFAENIFISDKVFILHSKIFFKYLFKI